MERTNVFSTVYAEKQDVKRNSSSSCINSAICGVVFNSMHKINNSAETKYINCLYTDSAIFKGSMSGCKFISCDFTGVEFNDFKFINCEFNSCKFRNNTYTYFFGGSSIFKNCKLINTKNYDVLKNECYESLLTKVRKKRVNYSCELNKFATEMIVEIKEYDKFGEFSMHPVVFEQIEPGIYQFFHNVKKYSGLCPICYNKKSECTCSNNYSSVTMLYTLKEIDIILKRYGVDYISDIRYID